jgi:ABC-type molybdate transport system substrate-binding protein
LAVKKGNEKKIRTVDDLLRPDIRVGQANPDIAAIGKVVREAMTKAGKWDDLAKKTAVYKGTVNDVATDIKIGAIDAGFVWDANVKQYPDLEAVPTPELTGQGSLVSAAVLKTSKRPTEALRFARYLAAKDRGLPHFTKHGYDVVEGDTWAQNPELRLLAGAMLRPAIEQTIDRFEQREGVSVTRVYNGCGILVAQMKAGERPDGYFACDLSFMDQVKDLYLDAEPISQNQLVILVHKGNPHSIKALKDLGNDGVRVGVGHEKQCALGVLTAETLRQDGTFDVVRKNVRVESATGDGLVNQLRTGSLDAVVAYVSNAATAGDTLEAIKIDIPCAMATQPIAVGKESEHKQLMARLVAAIKSAESEEEFKRNGFYWGLPKTKTVDKSRAPVPSVPSPGKPGEG